MKIVYYTTGITGSGRVVRGISIGNALKRNNINCEYIILNSSSFAHLADKFNILHTEIPVENEIELSKENVHNSILYKTLSNLNPDVLLIDLLWFPLYHFIHEFNCIKIFLCHYVIDQFFTIQLEDDIISIRPEDYDLLIAVEPFTCKIPMQQINPIILRNRNEIQSRKKALDSLNLNDSQKICLYAFNAHPNDFEKYKKKYSYLKDIGYQIVYTTNYKEGIFPVVDYFNAFDLIITSAGYNSFWEAIYFDKEAIFENIRLRFESTERRINECQEYYFDENGADQLVNIIMNM